MNNLSCEIIKDLIPLYVDKASCDETNSLVRNHVKTCRNCRKYLAGCRRITRTSEENVGGENHYEAFSKKLKGRRNLRTGITVAALLLALVNLAMSVRKLTRIVSQTNEKIN